MIFNLQSQDEKKFKQEKSTQNIHTEYSHRIFTQKIHIENSHRKSTQKIHTENSHTKFAKKYQNKYYKQSQDMNILKE